MEKLKRLRTLTGAMALFSVSVLSAGCPCWWEAPRTEVVTLLSGDTNALMKQLLTEFRQGQSGVDIDDVQSLTVAVKHIELHRAAADEPGDGEQNQTGGEQDPADIVAVFDGELDLDLKRLYGVSEVLSAAEVPPGRYTQIRLAISDPRLVLAAEPETVITDIQLTANDQLFITEQFDIPEGQTSLILLDFGGIHLVAQGNGGYTLTPQLRALVNIQNADVVLAGTIAAIDEGAGLLLLTLADGSELEVDYTVANIYLPADSTVPTGTTADLAVGQGIEVTGVINLQGVVTAQSIYLGA